MFFFYCSETDPEVTLIVNHLHVLNDAFKWLIKYFLQWCLDILNGALENNFITLRLCFMCVDTYL